MTHFKIGIIALLSWLFVVQPVMAGSLVDDKAATPVRLPDKPTYVASTAAKTATVASAAPFFAICGSSTNTIRVRQIMIDYTVATTALHMDPILQKTSTATTTSGSATDLTKVPLDSKYPASTSNLVKIYTTATVTTGTVVGTIAAQMKWAQVTATVTGGSASPYPFLYRPYSESDAVVLRGTAECVQAAWGTAPGTAPTVTISVMWTEE